MFWTQCPTISYRNWGTKINEEQVRDSRVTDSLSPGMLRFVLDLPTCPSCYVNDFPCYKPCTVVREFIMFDYMRLHQHLWFMTKKATVHQTILPVYPYDHLVVSLWTIIKSPMKWCLELLEPIINSLLLWFRYHLWNHDYPSLSSIIHHSLPLPAMLSPRFAERTEIPAALPGLKETSHRENPPFVSAQEWP
jgi:hypothetical protein